MLFTTISPSSSYSPSSLAVAVAVSFFLLLTALPSVSTALIEDIIDEVSATAAAGNRMSVWVPSLNAHVTFQANS
jgi:hypothetical protein